VKEYKEDHYYFEILRLYFRIFIVLTIFLLEGLPYARGSILIGLLFLYYLAARNWHPYKVHIVENIDVLEILVMIYTINSLVLSLEIDNGFINLVIITMMMILNSILFLSLITLILNKKL
jgi:hypothetical protein